MSAMSSAALPARVYHLAEAANWSSIQRLGLLPAATLIERAGWPASRAREWRSAHTILPGGAEIRDQRPMPAPALLRALVGLTPAEWYGLINARVFCWLDPERLNRQCAACGPRPQIVLTLDTAALLARHADAAAVSPINTGNARRAPARRGRATFVPVAQWARDGWATEAAALGTRPRSRSHAPVELTFAEPLPAATLRAALVSATPAAPGGRFAP